MEAEVEILKQGGSVFREGEHKPKRVYPAVKVLIAAGFETAQVCRVLKVSRSGYYSSLARTESFRTVRDRELADTIRETFIRSRESYGARRIHAELRHGLGIRIGKKRVARLMKASGLRGISHRRKYRKYGPLPAVHQDLVKRQFKATKPDQTWVTDITEHPTLDGKLYCAAVLDVYSRRIVGLAIADRIRSELVVDALEMAKWRRKPEPGTIVHSDWGSQYTSWIFGHRLREAGLLGSMGRVASMSITR